MTEWNLDDYKTVTWGSLVVNWNFLNGRLISKCHLTYNEIEGEDIMPSVNCIFIELTSASKSNTRSFVSSVPFLEPTAHTSLVGLERILQTTPPEPPESRATRSRINSPRHVKMKFRLQTIKWLWPVLTSQSLTVPSSLLVITNLLLNWRHVTADWCLLGPGR